MSGVQMSGVQMSRVQMSDSLYRGTVNRGSTVSIFSKKVYYNLIAGYTDCNSYYTHHIKLLNVGSRHRLWLQLN